LAERTPEALATLKMTISYGFIHSYKKIEEVCRGRVRRVKMMGDGTDGFRR
jgi:hypothetical protein